MAIAQFGAAIATAIEHRSTEVADNVSNHNAVYAVMKKNKGIKTFSGGTEIRELLSFGGNGNAQWYSAYDVLNNAPQDVIDSAAFSIKQASVAVSLSGLDTIMNSGKEAVIDRLEAELDVAEASLTNLLVAGLYSDGTGASGKQLTGLAAAVPSANTSGTYGGINRSTWTFWRNQKLKGGGVDFSGSVTSANVQGLMNDMWLRTTRGSDAVNVIIAENSLYTAFMASLQPQQRFTDPELAALGFTNTRYQSAPVVHEPTSSGIGPGRMYFLNTKYLKLRPFAGRNMVALDPEGRQRPFNQDATTQYMVWAGNLTCNRTAAQGIIEN